MDLKIKNVEDKDYPELREIFLKVRKDSFNWMDREEFKLSDFDESTKDEIILVAWEEDKIIGFVSIWEEDKFIHNLFILKEYQARGVGSKLIEKTIEEVGLPLSLKCLVANENALNYYRSKGWEIEREELDIEDPYYFMVYSGK